MPKRPEPRLEDLPIVDGYRVDVPALLSIAHICDPKVCKHTDTCCKSFEVEIEAYEEQRAVDMMSSALKYQRELVEDGEFIDPIDETDTGACLATHEDGRCVFAFYTRSREIRCSLHAAALEHDLRPEDVKPGPCSLWPLAIVEELDPPLLTLQENAPEFPCNTMRGRKTLSPGVVEIIGSMLGTEFLGHLQARLRLERAS